MTQWLARMALGLTLSVLTLGAVATEAAPAAAVDQAVVKARAEALVGAPVRSLKDAPLPGFYEAISEQGIFYISKDGEHLLWGKLFRLGSPVAHVRSLGEGVQVEVADGDSLHAARVVVAVGPEAVNELTGLSTPATNGLQTWWFAAT